MEILIMEQNPKTGQVREIEKYTKPYEVRGVEIIGKNVYIEVTRNEPPRSV